MMNDKELQEHFHSQCDTFDQYIYDIYHNKSPVYAVTYSLYVIAKTLAILSPISRSAVRGDVIKVMYDIGDEMFEDEDDLETKLMEIAYDRANTKTS